VKEATTRAIIQAIHEMTQQLTLQRDEIIQSGVLNDILIDHENNVELAFEEYIRMECDKIRLEDRHIDAIFHKLMFDLL